MPTTWFLGKEEQHEIMSMQKPGGLKQMKDNIEYKVKHMKDEKLELQSLY